MPFYLFQDFVFLLHLKEKKLLCIHIRAMSFWFCFILLIFFGCFVTQFCSLCGIFAHSMRSSITLFPSLAYLIKQTNQCLFKIWPLKFFYLNYAKYTYNEENAIFLFFSHSFIPSNISTETTPAFRDRLFFFLSFCFLAIALFVLPLFVPFSFNLFCFSSYRFIFCILFLALLQTCSHSNGSVIYHI